VVAAEHAIADGDPGDVVTRPDHRADEFVADREPGLDLHPAVVDVQIGAADPARLDPHDRVIAGQELGLGTVLDPDLARRPIGDRSHRGRLLIVGGFSSWGAIHS